MRACVRVGVTVCVCIVCSYVFVMGDFNFRTDELSASEVKNRITAGNLQSLWTYDQVTGSRHFIR